MRALARAVALFPDEDDDLREMELRESRPTAMTVSRIISDKVTIRAKPLFVRDGAETALE
jgi:hypothetical protein